MKVVVDGRWAYETDYDVRVGDTVILPTADFLVNVKGRTWEGTVTSIGSDYTGHCDRILGVKQNRKRIKTTISDTKNRMEYHRQMADAFKTIGEILRKEAKNGNKDICLRQASQSSNMVMDLRIVWNKDSLKEIDEAKRNYLIYRARGHEILTAAGKRMDRFQPYAEEIIVKAHRTGKRVMKILCQNGDDRIIWDKENGKEAKEAKAKFEELLKKGYTAYSVDVSGNKNRKIDEFDIDAEEILMVPPTAKG